MFVHVDIKNYMRCRLRLAGLSSKRSHLCFPGFSSKLQLLPSLFYVFSYVSEIKVYTQFSEQESKQLSNYICNFCPCLACLQASGTMPFGMSCYNFLITTIYFTIKVNTRGLLQLLAIIIKQIELTWLHTWYNVWIETDSMLVFHFFRSPISVPWQLRVDRQNCLERLWFMSFTVCHIFVK